MYGSSSALAQCALARLSFRDIDCWPRAPAPAAAACAPRAAASSSVMSSCGRCGASVYSHLQLLMVVRRMERLVAVYERVDNNVFVTRHGLSTRLVHVPRAHVVHARHGHGHELELERDIAMPWVPTHRNKNQRLTETSNTQGPVRANTHTRVYTRLTARSPRQQAA